MPHMHPLHCLTKPGAPPATPLVDLEKLLNRPRKIRCPLCAWVPRASDRWCCKPGCWHSWNTFDTQGRCPKCDYQWEVTACLKCHRYSRHRDWYVDDDDAGGAA